MLEKKSNIIQKIQKQKHFISSKILPKAENITNDKYKKNAKDKSKPKSFELTYIK